MAEIRQGSLLKMKRDEILSGYLFLVPVLSLLGLFVFYGLFYVIKLSFYKWDGFIPDSMVFRGLKNYQLLFTDPLFYKALGNVFIFMVSTVTIQMFLGLTIALLLRERYKGHSIFKAIFYIPVTLSTVVIARIFMGLYEPYFGVINTVLRSIGLESFTRVWLGDPSTALWCIIIANIFQWTGAQMVFYIAGLTTIGDEIFEAAQIDGAGFWKTFKSIVLPGLWSTHTTVIILGVVGAIKTFDIVWLLTQGGPGNSTQFPATLLYQAVAQNSQAGYGAAISVLMIIMSVILSAVQIKFNKKRQEV
ncbi:sugar ABC transporter permease [Thiospirochaeta perfilievii]|uniref:Sugar ABC transporter permease n=1 Tax=Thiospirochaeta perfilievii TaxID=252967 RepID=A0A5C1QAZ3_9SPIO|nr:sugar ABC transporter permease [Thiospirochaeta perfilievii]QEN04657.1 sugar ABC transporter permease [Thiospirochaeta perfilievii]